MSLEAAAEKCIDASLCMHPLTPDEAKTYTNIAQQCVQHNTPCTIYPLPTHCIGADDGKLRGFVYVCPDVHAGVSTLPLCRDMFHGHTAVECAASSADIVRLLTNQEATAARMREFVQAVCARQRQGPVPTLECRPSGGAAARIKSQEYSMDAAEWVPEMPASIGLYHAFVRGHNRDTRAHKLFIVVSGGCYKASDEFYNMVLDCHGQASVKDCATSQEAWWLRRACYRARCRLLADCAAHFGMQVPLLKDTKAYSMQEQQPDMAVSTIDTVTHDLLLASGNCCLFDGCTPVADIKNGMLCSMHPSEGFWIFQGVHNRAQGSTNCYGVGWSMHPHAAMPASVIRGPPPSGGKYATVTSSDAAFIARINPVTQEHAPAERAAAYQFFDHSALTFLSGKLGWPRDRGVVELIPIAVGLSAGTSS